MDKLERLQRAKRRLLNRTQQSIELELMNENISESDFDFSFSFYFVIRDANIKLADINVKLQALVDMDAERMPAK